jgi:hypothetical protein
MTSLHHIAGVAAGAVQRRRRRIFRWNFSKKEEGKERKEGIFRNSVLQRIDCIQD